MKRKLANESKHHSEPKMKVSGLQFLMSPTCTHEMNVNFGGRSIWFCLDKQKTSSKLTFKPWEDYRNICIFVWFRLATFTINTNFLLLFLTHRVTFFTQSAASFGFKRNNYVETDILAFLLQGVKKTPLGSFTWMIQDQSLPSSCVITLSQERRRGQRHHHRPPPQRPQSKQVTNLQHGVPDEQLPRLIGCKEGQRSSVGG